MKFFKEVKDKFSGHQQNQPQIQNDVILTKDQNEFISNNKKETELESQDIVLPSRAYFYNDIPYNITVRELTVSEALKLQEIYNRIIINKNYINDTVKNRVYSIVSKNAVISDLDKEYIDKLLRDFQNKNLYLKHQNPSFEGKDEYAYITTDLINVFQNCVLTKNVNLRNFTIEDFYFVCYSIILLTVQNSGFNYICDFNRYNIKCHFQITSEDISAIFNDKGMSVDLEKKFSNLIKEWKSYNFTPPLIKYIEIFNNNFYKENLTPEENSNYGFWDADITYLYSTCGMYINGENVKEQLKNLIGASYRKKAKYIASLSTFKKFYNDYIKYNYYIVKEVKVSNYDYTNLQQLIDGLLLYKDEINNKMLENPDDKKYKLELEDCNNEIRDLKKIKEKCKDITDAYKEFKSKSLPVRIDLDLPRCIAQI